jgi:hypothetical protein
MFEGAAQYWACGIVQVGEGIMGVSKGHVPHL